VSSGLIASPVDKGQLQPDWGDFADEVAEKKKHRPDRLDRLGP